MLPVSLPSECNLFTSFFFCLLLCHSWFFIAPDKHIFLKNVLRVPAFLSYCSTCKVFYFKILCAYMFALYHTGVLWWKQMLFICINCVALCAVIVLDRYQCYNEFSNVMEDWRNISLLDNLSSNRRYFFSFHLWKMFTFRFWFLRIDGSGSPVD